MSDESIRDVICEVCIESVEGALAAERGGADRLELCGELVLGGISPSVGLLRQVVAATSLPVMAMVRPRAGGFCYLPSEIEMMATEIAFLKGESVAGVVFGILTQDGRVDIDACKRLTDLARPLSVTFHRAFDWTRDADEAIDDLIEVGVDRVLTSGQQPTAEAGGSLLRRIADRAGQKISIMPGSGVAEDNVQNILDVVGTNEIHFSGGVLAKSDDSFQREDVPMMSVQNYIARTTSEQRIRQITQAAKRYAN